ncbi:MAG: hypothetical protein GF400_00745 [Candidatus Eisenbacteria bacterium]|nr:hypothetical protein [Candidatus Eisenbacteria bacterium]
MKHLMPANCGRAAAASSNGDAEYCLVDYASCSQSDICWLVDMDDNCDSSDGCIIDVS